MKVEQISKTTGINSYEGLTSEEIISAIARHGTIKDDNGKLITYLMDNSHWSPLEHVFFGFKIETRRSISAQIFRHWTLKAQELSQRYSKGSAFETIELRKEHPTNRQSSTDIINPIILYKSKYKDANTAILEHLESTDNLYNTLIDADVARECARDILPLCTKTLIHISGNLRDLLSFLNVRCDSHAQKEIQLIAVEIGKCLEKELPKVFKIIDWRKGMFM